MPADTATEQARQNYGVLSRLKRSKLAMTTVAWALGGIEIAAYHDVDREYCTWLFLGCCAVTCLYLYAQGRVDEITNTPPPGP